MKINSENILLSSTEYIKHKEYWLDILENYQEPNYFLSYKESNNKIVHFRNLRISTFELNKDITSQLFYVSKDNLLSLHIILLTTLQITMYKYSGHDSVMTGIPSLLRGNKVNEYIPIKATFHKELPFKDCILKMGNIVKEAFSHQDYPLEDVLDINTMCTVTCQLKGSGILREDVGMKGLLNFVFSTEYHNLVCDIYYNEETFDEEMINYIYHYFCNVLESFVTDNEIRLGNISLNGPEEEKILLDSFQSPKLFYEYDTITDYLEYNFRNYPQRVILEDDNRKIRFRELLEQSNQIINYLLEKEFKKGDRIAILLERNVEYIIAIAAVIRAGGTYIPLDDTMPIDRVNYILENSEAKFLFLSKNYCMRDKIHMQTCIRIQDCLDYPISLEKNIGKDIRKTDVAYIIYTSGTTGFPKGVMIEHEGIVNLIMGFKASIYSNLKEDACFGFLSPFCFDASIQGVFGAFILGVRLYVISKEVRLDSKRLMDKVQTEHINIMDGTPMDLKLLLYGEAKKLFSLEYLLIGGEALSKEVVTGFFHKFSENYQIFNLYGPTETVVDATYLSVQRNDMNKYREMIPIGYPFPNKRVYILGRDKELLPIGSVGEIYISGKGIMKGYVNNQCLNERCLSKDPFVEKYMMYKTGDYGYWKSDGTIVYVGRKDNQIKIDGYRIELGEIEELLRKHPLIKEVVVLLEEKDNINFLTCYYTSNQIVDMALIMDYMKSFVPNYMIPKNMIQVNKIPYNVNGKVDRKVLSTMEPINDKRELVSPRDKMESDILEQLRLLLHNEDIGIEDNFFQVGGDSLKALQFIMLLKNLGIELTMLDVFTYQTIRSLYDHMNQVNRKVIRDIKIAEEQLVKEFHEEFSFYKDTYEKKDILYLIYERECRDMEQWNNYMMDHFDMSLIPHYIMHKNQWSLYSEQKVIGESSVVHIIVEELCQEYFNDMIDSWRKFENSILKNQIEDSYTLSGIQKTMLNYDLSHSGINIVLEQPIVVDKFQNAFRQVLNRHPLLRSVFIQMGEEYYCEQYSIPDETYEIPILDLSAIPISTQEILITRLLNLLYYSESNAFQHLLYKAFLIKKNNKEYILSVPCHHSIFDGMSGDVLKKSILDSYHNRGDSKIFPYVDYKNTMENEVIRMSDREVVEFYQLGLFSDFFRHQNLESTAYTSTIVEVEVECMEGKEWEFSLEIFRGLLFAIYQESQIPVYILNFGRHYKVKDYFDYFGAFIDMIPCVFHQKDTIEELTKRVKENISYAVDHNINLLSAVFDPKILSQKEHLKKLELDKQPMIIFNYQGGTDKDNYELRNNLVEKVTDKKLANQKVFEGIYCEVLHTENKFKFNIGGTWIIDDVEHKLTEFSNLCNNQ